MKSQSLLKSSSLFLSSPYIHNTTSHTHTLSHTALKIAMTFILVMFLLYNLLRDQKFSVIYSISFEIEKLSINIINI